MTKKNQIDNNLMLELHSTFGAMAHGISNVDLDWVISMASIRVDELKKAYDKAGVLKGDAKNFAEGIGEIRKDYVLTDEDGKPMQFQVPNNPHQTFTKVADSVLWADRVAKFREDNPLLAKAADEHDERMLALGDKKADVNFETIAKKDLPKDALTRGQMKILIAAGIIVA